MDFWDINKPYERTVVLQVRTQSNQDLNKSENYVNILFLGPRLGTAQDDRLR